MRDLGAVADGGIFDLHKVADAAVIAHTGIRPQVGVGADGGLLAYSAVQQNAAFHSGSPAHYGVVQPVIGVEHAVRADAGAALQGIARVDHHAGSNDYVAFHDRSVAIQENHAVFFVTGNIPLVDLLVGSGKLRR